MNKETRPAPMQEDFICPVMYCDAINDWVKEQTQRNELFNKLNLEG